MGDTVPTLDSVSGYVPGKFSLGDAVAPTGVCEHGAGAVGV